MLDEIFSDLHVSSLICCLFINFLFVFSVFYCCIFKQVLSEKSLRWITCFETKNRGIPLTKKNNKTGLRLMHSHLLANLAECSRFKKVKGQFKLRVCISFLRQQLQKNKIKNVCTSVQKLVWNLIETMFKQQKIMHLHKLQFTSF